ncbi:MAG TPA: cobalamin-dependent protein [Longimicrobiaceae bacterium]|nr:cobalamin-dependent protein [Longimicrobiaceae bacterium]
MSHEECYSSYLAALCAGDRRSAFAAIGQGREAGLDLRTLYLDVFQPALREVGRLWQENRMNVAEEHLATAITETAMLRLYMEQEIRKEGGPALVAACAETERHAVGLRMLCDLMELEGWHTTFLGASVPTDDLIELLRRRKADVLALSVAIDPHLPQLRRTITAVRETLGDTSPLVIVGGRPFLERPELAGVVGADLTAPDAATAALLLGERVR